MHSGRYFDVVCCIPVQLELKLIAFSMELQQCNQLVYIKVETVN